jgi:hypothetical protein
MQLGTEEKHLSLKRLVIIFVIFFAILVIILLILHFDKVKQAANQIINPQAKDKEKETTPAQVSESQSNIEQIKMDIITGKREDVPAGFSVTKDAIINEYLYACSVKDDVNVRISCSEIYYLNSDESLKQQKEGCEKLENPDKIKCLDNYYFKIATTLQEDYCEAITDLSLKEECMAKAN